MIYTESISNSKCPRCRDTGWVLYRKFCEDVGYEAEFARPCESCRGYVRKGRYIGIPDQYVGKGLASFEQSYYGSGTNIEKIVEAVDSVVKKPEAWMKSRNWIYLWSDTPGSGKTMLACIVINMLMSTYKCRFVSASDYIQKVGGSIRRDEGQPDQSAVFRNAEILVIDDLGAQKSGEWRDEVLYKLFEDRSRLNAITIITSNVPPEKLKTWKRTASRIASNSMVFHVPEVSVRDLISKQKQRKFYEDVVKGGKD